MIPIVIEKDGRSERAFDIYSRLLKDRIIYCTGSIEENMASSICAQLLFLESEDPEKEINLYIMSGGGEVSSGLAIIDTMTFIKPDIRTICLGMAASMGAMILASGTKGKRMSLPHSKIMVHQVSSGARGTAADMEISIKETLRTNNVLTKMLVDSTGKTIKQVEKAMDRDSWFDAKEAIDFGLIDKIIEKRNVE